MRRAGGPLAALSVCLCLGLAAVPAASGDPDHGSSGGAKKSDRAFPSKKQVDAARGRAAHKADQVRVIKSRLAVANQRLEAAGLAAEQASEAYNGAMWRLQEAKRHYRTARADAERARRTVREQRGRIGALVAQSYQNGGDLTALKAMMSADGPAGVLDQYAGFQGASTSLQADYKRYAAAESLARVFEAKAKDAKAEQTHLAGLARQARQRAVAAASAAQAQTDSIAALQDQLVSELARAQHISLSMARQRQAALEEIARKRAEERARQAALAAARARARAEAKAAAAQRSASHDAVWVERLGWVGRLWWWHDRAATASSSGSAARAKRGRRPGDPVRQGTARRALPVGGRRTELVGLLGADHAGVGFGRALPPALLGRAVRVGHTDPGQRRQGR